MNQSTYPDQIPIIRSDRRTLAVVVRRDGSVIIRAPYRMPQSEIDKFVRSRRDWIEAHQKRAEEKAAATKPDHILTSAELNALAQEALKVLPARAAYYAPKVGVTYNRITIRNQRTRWGSCSSKGNLNFNCLLMLTPPEVQDSIVVHELCHRLEPNHSDRFYAHVLRVFPNYWECHRWLKENEAAILRRMTG